MKMRLPEMEGLIAHCIRARNFFVHGTGTKMTAEQVYGHAPFFTDTLEFVFGAYELKKCRWNIDRWLKESFSFSRLKSYMFSYKQRLALLRHDLGDNF
jgi:hypothetical protein